MTDTSAILSSLSPGAGPASSATRAQSQIAGNFQTFLKLLTTQLQYQDPMSPMDSNEFTAQLVQFAGVEQSIATNKNLENLVNFALANATSAAVGYLGREVTAGGETATLGSEGAHWSYTLPRAAASNNITIVDTAGKVIYKGQGAVTQGEHTFAWDGRTSTGQAAPPGSYKILIAAKDPGGNDIAVAPQVKGVVSSVDIEGGTPMLNVGGVKLKLADVISVGAAPAPTTTTSSDN
jgi:flagellar basal-body rod modification protein FlgD